MRDGEMEIGDSLHVQANYNIIVFVSSDGDKTSILLLSTSIQRKIFSAISSTSANPLPHTSHINHNKSSSFDLPV